MRRTLVSNAGNTSLLLMEPLDKSLIPTFYRISMWRNFSRKHGDVANKGKKSDDIYY